ncbi:MAG TPA: RNA polymerase sigma-54 factor, partial [Syntrophales bacterium]|nr:RNA polymerase sigma-54 factor [Syntrophales bacterium]
MTFELKQSLKLSQQLIMTPQLQQAIKLLQLSRIELVDMIQQEMEENPLLEERSTEEFGDEGAPAPEVDEVKAVERTGEVTGEGDGKEDFDWNNYLEDYGPMRVTYDREEDEGPSWENMLSRKTTLTDHLMWQLGLSRMNEAERRVGEQIIGNLDSSGYLAASIEEIAVQEKTGADHVEKVLAKIQEFDPPGIASRDLKECLMIQAKVLGAENSLVEIIVRDYLHDLENKNYNNIAKKLKVPLAEVLDAIFLISRMDPKPGLVYSDEGPQYIIPDVFVFKVADEYKIILNDEGLPR